MPVFDVTVLCQDDDGSRTVLDKTIVVADNERDANHKARDEIWDERLTGHYLCVYQSVEIENPCKICNNEAPGNCGACESVVCEDCCGLCCTTS